MPICEIEGLPAGWRLVVSFPNGKERNRYILERVQPVESVMKLCEYEEKPTTETLLRAIAYYEREE